MILLGTICLMCNLTSHDIWIRWWRKLFDIQPFSWTRLRFSTSWTETWMARPTTCFRLPTKTGWNRNVEISSSDRQERLIQVIRLNLVRKFTIIVDSLNILYTQAASSVWWKTKFCWNIKVYVRSIKYYGGPTPDIKSALTASSKYPTILGL